MSGSSFVYVTYIRTTPEKLWEALTNSEFTRQYWFGVTQDCDWKVGSPWSLTLPDGRLADVGEVLEIDAPRRLVLSWRNEFMPEFNAEGYGRCEYNLEPQNGVVKFTVTHSIDKEDSKLIKGVSGGWPHILSNLKTLLETGEVLPAWA